MIKLIPVRVECYSGYKADEYPRAFCRGDERTEIAEIIDRWYQGDNNPEFPASDYFKVKNASGDQFILKHDLTSDSWYLCA